jgi:hypothetical protein
MFEYCPFDLGKELKMSRNDAKRARQQDGHVGEGKMWLLQADEKPSAPEAAYKD